MKHSIAPLKFAGRVIPPPGTRVRLRLRRRQRVKRGTVLPSSDFTDSSPYTAPKPAQLPIAVTIAPARFGAVAPPTQPPANAPAQPPLSLAVVLMKGAGVPCWILCVMEEPTLTDVFATPSTRALCHPRQPRLVALRKMESGCPESRAGCGVIWLKGSRRNVHKCSERNNGFV